MDYFLVPIDHASTYTHHLIKLAILCKLLELALLAINICVTEHGLAFT